MGWLASAVLWVLCAFLTVRMAKNRGREPVGWFIFSLILSPIAAWITLAVIGNRNSITDGS